MLSGGPRFSLLRLYPPTNVDRPLNLDVGAVTGLLWDAPARPGKQKRGAPSVVVSHPDRPTLARRALRPGRPLGKWLKGSSKPGCTVQINEGIVDTSELMGVTSEAAERSLKTRTLRTEASAQTGCRGSLAQFVEVPAA